MKPAKLLAAGCVLATIAGAIAAQQAQPDSTADLQLGRKVYAEACQECHGTEGHGDGPKARKLGFHPRKLSLGSFKCRCTESGDLPTDDDLYRVVTRGMSGTPMQPHEKTLSETERRAVVQYIKTLTPNFASAPPLRCVRLAPSPVQPTPVTVVEGEQIYRVLECWKCHGKTGKGDGPMAAGLKDDWGNPIRAYNFTVMKRFKCGVEDTDIYRTLLTGMNGSPMPSYAKALLFGREGTTDISAYQAEFDSAEFKELQDYLNRQPAEAAIKALSPQAQEDLEDRRAWALVYYLKSLTVN